MKKLFENWQKFVKEEHERRNEKGEPVPAESEFVASTQDEPAGYIAVYDKKKENLIAIAPIVRTDGVDRPFLVRTTDTSWKVPEYVVSMIYPHVEEVFNAVDSQLPWSKLGPGSSGEFNDLTWVWTNDNVEDPQPF
tara:strand:+ start:2054 stop:2461 length:408 start_codon:yes stop_codon:yes gene_type:complete